MSTEHLTLSMSSVEYLAAHGPLAPEGSTIASTSPWRCPRCGLGCDDPSPGARCPEDGGVWVAVEALAARPADPYLGAVLLDRYALWGIRRETPSGVSYSATEIATSAPVTLKIVPCRARWLDEITCLARGAGPRSEALLDYGELPTGGLYVATSAASGPCLGPGPMSARRALAVADQLLEALGRLHEAGVLHLSVAAPSVRLGESGQVIALEDMSRARLLEGEAAPPQPPLTPRGCAIMIPELLLGQACDPSADLYSVAALVVALITGAPLYGEGSPAEQAAAHLCGAPEVALAAALDEDGEPLSPALQGVLLRALARDPADRYRRGAEMRAALWQAALGFSLEAAPAPQAQPQPQPEPQPQPQPQRITPAPQPAFSASPAVSLSDELSLLAPAPWWGWRAIGALLCVALVGGGGVYAIEASRAPAPEISVREAEVDPSAEAHALYEGRLAAARAEAEAIERTREALEACQCAEAGRHVQSVRSGVRNALMAAWRRCVTPQPGERCRGLTGR